jgi:hypothetical protein
LIEMKKRKYEWMKKWSEGEEERKEDTKQTKK